MKIIGMSLTVALGVVLLGCEAQSQQSTAAQQHAESAPPEEALWHEEAHDETRTSHASSSAEHPHDDMHSMLRLDRGQPWATDAPLVEGMGRIRAAVTEASKRPTLDPESAAALALTVRDQVDFLIANCRLEPDADATLHVFIARLLNAADALQEEPASPLGLPQMRNVLRDYPRYFAHPGWQPEAVDAK